MKLFGRQGITRRRFLATSAAAGAVAAATSALAGCGSDGSAPKRTGEPQVVDDKSKIVDVLEDYEQHDGGFSAAATFDLPLGTVLFHSDGDWCAAMMAPESALVPNTVGVLSLATGKLATLITHATKGRGYTFFDVRCGADVFAWIEISYAKRTWTLMACGMSGGQLVGDPVELDHGDKNWDPAPCTASASTVIWQKMPSAGGDKTTEFSHCYAWTVGDAKPREIWESPGRFACAPRVSSGTVTIAPRVLADEGTYYGMTAVALDDTSNKPLAQLVLPAGVRPFEAVYMDDVFAFSIEASYEGRGSLGNMGTFIGREGGPYVYVSREPAACVAGKGRRYFVKARSSHCLVNTEEQTYAILASPDRSLDYGDYPASEGVTDRFVTYSTVKNDQGIPHSVTARVFAL